MPTALLVLTVALHQIGFCLISSLWLVFFTVIPSVCVSLSIHQLYQLLVTSFTMASEGGFLFPSSHLHSFVSTHWEEELSP